jgi:hypothetical protein
MTFHSDARGLLPDWLPRAHGLYLDHVEGGTALRALARRIGRHPSTVLRQVRRTEARRDDPLVDEALAVLAAELSVQNVDRHEEDHSPMPDCSVTRKPLPDAATLDREARRILRRLAEPDTVLAVAADLDKAAVLRDERRIATVDRAVAQAFALKDWITANRTGRVTTYRLTAAGRSALRRMLGPAAGVGLSEAATGFAAQHREMSERDFDAGPGEAPRRARVNLGESPVQVLARRSDRDGRPFLARDLVDAAERLREDFEIAQLGPRVAQNWDRFLTAGAQAPGRGGPPDRSDRAGAARDRVAAALADLGPGLGDMALRVCCFLEGLESAEKRLGWSARSGKIVLRIALIRLRRHYDETYGPGKPLIG